MIIPVTLLLLVNQVARAANWAQTSGDVKQNVVIPYYPSANREHWNARYGHATVVADGLAIAAVS